MAKNLGLTHGLIVSEAVMMGLAPVIGRQRGARPRLRRLPGAALKSNRPLADILLETPSIASELGAEKIGALTDPANYLGAAQAMVDRVLDGR